MNTFRILLGIDSFAALVVLYFFFIGLSDRSVSSRNIGLWAGILMGLAAIIFGSIAMRHQFHGLSIALLCVPAVPALIYLLFILVTIFGRGRWN